MRMPESGKVNSLAIVSFSVVCRIDVFVQKFVPLKFCSKTHHLTTVV